MRKRLHRSRFCRALGALLFLGSVTSWAGQAAAAEAWPSRTVRMIVPFPSGSAIDAVARLYADGLARRWGKPVVVDNRPGADAAIGTGTFAAARDDHTLLYSTASTITVNPLLMEKLPYDPERDLVPIAAGASSIIVVAVNGALPVQTLNDLLALAKARPGELFWGSGPSLPHFSFAAFVKHNNLDMNYVPYRDIAAPLSDLGEGRIQILCHALQTVAGLAATGKARILAVTSGARFAALPGIPTVAEAGYPEMQIEGLSGLFGGRDMPSDLRARIAVDMQALAQDPSLRARLQSASQNVVSGTAADFVAAIERQRNRVRYVAHLIDLANSAK